MGDQQRKNRFEKTLNRLWVLVERILTFPLSIILHVIIFIEDTARWSDRRFNTRFLKPKYTVQGLEKLIDAQLPIGSSVADVISFLKSMKFRHSASAENVFRLGSDFEHSKLDGKRESVKKSVAGMIDVGGGILVKGVIKTIFYFDENEALVVHTVQWFGIGL
jgi:hypothetical protein